MERRALVARIVRRWIRLPVARRERSERRRAAHRTAARIAVQVRTIRCPRRTCPPLSQSPRRTPASGHAPAPVDEPVSPGRASAESGDESGPAMLARSRTGPLGAPASASAIDSRPRRGAQRPQPAGLLLVAPRDALQPAESRERAKRRPEREQLQQAATPRVQANRPACEWSWGIRRPSARLRQPESNPRRWSIVHGGWYR